MSLLKILGGANVPIELQDFWHNQDISIDLKSKFKSTLVCIKFQDLFTFYNQNSGRVQVSRGYL